jgi:hypothetical protein
MKRGDRTAIFIANIPSCLLLKIEKGGPFTGMRENQFQAKLIKELKDIFPGCIIMKNDSGYLQGIPDLLVLYNDKWASLECKRSAVAKRQPNQEYYVGKMNEMSFSRFICPENKEEVLHDLQQAFNL